MDSDDELLQRLRDNKDIRPEDITNNKENIEVLKESTDYLNYDFNGSKKKTKNNGD